MNPDGSLRGAPSINEYYKGVFALTCAGRHQAAERMFNYIVGRFLKKNGDLDGTGNPWYDQFRIYCHGWVAMAALQLARFDVSERILGFLEGFHDPRAGGFFGTLKDRKNRAEQEMMTTGVLAIAMLWGGRIDLARKVAVWFENVWEAQPNLEGGLYFVWHARNGLVTEFPAETALSHWVNPREKTQWYFQYGIPAAFLSVFSAAVKEPRWLKLGQKYLHASRHCGEDRYSTPQSGKIGWGAAWTYRLSRDEKDRALIATVFRGLQSNQSTEGWWPGQSAYGNQKAVNPLPSLDITGEFTALLSWMEPYV